MSDICFTIINVIEDSDTYDAIVGFTKSNYVAQLLQEDLYRCQQTSINECDGLAEYTIEDIQCTLYCQILNKPGRLLGELEQLVDLCNNQVNTIQLDYTTGFDITFRYQSEQTLQDIKSRILEFENSVVEYTNLNLTNSDILHVMKELLSNSFPEFTINLRNRNGGNKC